MSKSIIAVLALVAGVVLALSFRGAGPIAEGARHNTPTPTPQPTWTPKAQPPVAPKDVRLVGYVVSWTDSSDNEDGFSIGIYGCNYQRYFYQVPANTTSFSLPPEVQPFIYCCGSSAVEIIAFNSNGRSERALFQREALCAAPTETPTPFISLPPTGMGGGRGSSEGWLSLSLVGGAISLAAGIGIFAHVRTQGGKKAL